MSIPSSTILLNVVNKPFHKCYNFEGYYNRDSLKYKSLYGLHDAHTLIRGTLRFKGYAFIFQCFKHLDLFNLDTNVKLNTQTWRGFLNSVVTAEKINEGKEKYFSDGKKKIELRHRDGQVDSNESEFYNNLVYFCLADFPESYFEKNSLKENVNRFVSAMEFLNFYCPDNINSLTELLTNH